MRIMNTKVAEILELSVAERLEIVEDICDSIAADSDEIPISDELRAELDRRLAEHERNPEAGVSWPILKARLLAKK